MVAGRPAGERVRSVIAAGGAHHVLTSSWHPGRPGTHRRSQEPDARMPVEGRVAAGSLPHRRLACGGPGIYVAWTWLPSAHQAMEALQRVTQAGRGSLSLPVKAVLLNLASSGAACGVIVLIGNAVNTTALARSGPARHRGRSRTRARRDCIPAWGGSAPGAGQVVHLLGAVQFAAAGSLLWARGARLFIRGSSGPTGVTCLGPTLIV